MTTTLLLRTNLVKQLEIIFNCKEAINPIYDNGDVSFSHNTDHCDYTDSSLCNPHNKHIITGDLLKSH